MIERGGAVFVLPAGVTFALLASVTFALLASLMFAEPAAAQRLIHRVRFGETFTSLAKHYYGTRDVAPLLALVNGRTQKSHPRAGERIRVPTAWVHRVGRTTSVRKLAKQLLGDSRRYFALSEFNRLRGSRVRAGRDILVPFVLTHVAQRAESFVDLAQRFYGDRKQARLIARYNFVRGPTPRPGKQLSIPIARVRILPLRLQQLTNERLLGVTGASSDRREAVQEANALLRRGDYWRVPLRVIRMLAEEHISDSYIADVFKLMAIAYVAVDRHDLAVRAFREALLRQPSLKLDAVRNSPKVIRAFLDAKSSPETTLQR